MIKIYTDGSCSLQTKKGGWAVIILEYDGENYIKKKGAIKNCTNQIAEMYAMLNALFVASVYELTQKNKIEIYSDSAYVVNCINYKWYEKWQNNGWLTSNGFAVKNKELWVRIIAEYSLLVCTKVIKIKRNTDKWSAMADQIAKSFLEK